MSLAAILICGCTTMHAVAPAAFEATLGGLKRGDQIAVRTVAGWQEKLTVLSVTDSSIQAEMPGGERVGFGRSEVAEIQVRVRAPGKTAGLAAGIFFGVLGSGIPGASL